MTSREEALARIDELYAQLPTVECRGLCHDSCVTGIGITALEADRVKEATGRTIAPSLRPEALTRAIGAGHQPRCPLLGPLNNCTAYEQRPLVCRAFGMVGAPDPSGQPLSTQQLMCDHGCRPTGVISNELFWTIQIEIELLSRRVTGRRALFTDHDDDHLAAERKLQLAKLAQMGGTGRWDMTDPVWAARSSPRTGIARRY